ncbi:hypothetical protein GCM10018775_88510 [Streptomyces umbrinus]|nr:hypothetical protein GCM10018775_88510 [Streptomyces umbrinus]
MDPAKHIVYLNSFALNIGESMLSNRDGAYPPHWGVHEDGQYVEMLGAERVFYNDLAQPDAGKAAGELGPQSLISMRQPLTQAAWHDTPSTYVIGEKDAGLPAPTREKFRVHIGSVHRMDTSHSPFYSRSADTAALLREVLEGTHEQHSRSELLVTSYAGRLKVSATPTVPSAPSVRTPPAGVMCCSPHLRRASSTGNRERPASVSTYSSRGGWSQ